MNIRDLAAEFPKDAVHWRVQGQPYPRNGAHYAMALAYIDARDVMDRLDDVCGPENWQDSYTETTSGCVICTLSIRVGDEWVSKSDGAGGTQVEAEKGGVSDALKRAAVKWGIGRYLYRLDSPWVRCTVREKNGKAFWKAWDEDPWSKVKRTTYTAAQATAPQKEPEPQQKPTPEPVSTKAVETAIHNIETCDETEELAAYWKGLAQNQPAVAKHSDVIAAKDRRKATLANVSEPV